MDFFDLLQDYNDIEVGDQYAGCVPIRGGRAYSSRGFLELIQYQGLVFFIGGGRRNLRHFIIFRHLYNAIRTSMAIN